MSLLTQRWAAVGRPVADKRSNGLESKSLMVFKPLRIQAAPRTNRSVLRTVVMADTPSNGDGSNGVRLNKQGMVVSDAC